MTTEETLAQWEAEAQTIREASADATIGISTPQQLKERSGMQVFEDLFSGALPTPPINGTLDFELIKVEEGLAVFQGRPQFKHYNPLGTVHGGWFCTLLDSAVGCAIHSTLPAGKGYTTLELKVNMIRALTKEVPLVRAEGKVINVGRQVGIAEGRLYGADGKLYAHATTTCLVFDMP